MRLKINTIWSRILLVTLCSCSPQVSDVESETGDVKIPSIESLYDKAARQMQQNNFKAAASGFAKVQELYPYSKWATQAQLMEAYCRYQIHQYADAIDEFEIFCQLHPYHKETPYAYYMIGLSHYERISIVERDQEDAIKALEAFETVVRRYPTCNYAKDSKFKIDFIKNHLAAQEMQIGRFYQQERSYLAAINRFKNVVTKYETTEQVPEALMRLAECYATLNMKDEFLTIYSILQLNYPKSHWYHSVKKLHEKYIHSSQPALSNQPVLPKQSTADSTVAPTKGSNQPVVLPKQATSAAVDSSLKEKKKA